MRVPWLFLRGGQLGLGGCLLACLLALAAAQAQEAEANLLFDLTTFSVVDQPLPDAAESLRGEWLRLEDGSVGCTVQGTVAGRRRWLIPVHTDVRADCSVTYQAAGTNLDAPPGRSNLTVLLLRRPIAPDDPRRAARELLPEIREVPLYTAMAAEHNELGTKTFSTRDGDYRFAGVLAELALREPGPGTLQIQQLRVTFASNLPTDAELATALATPPATRAAVTRNAAGNLELQVNGRALPEIGYFAGEHHAGAAAAKLHAIAGLRLRRVAVNLGGPNPYFTHAEPLWTAPGYLRTAALDQLLQDALQQPDTYLMLDIILTHPPTWWPSLTERAYPYLSDLDPELREWRRRALRLVIGHLRQSPLGERVIGCHLVLGMGLNHAPPPGRETDPAYVAGFRDWLQNRYPTDSALRSAWAQPQMTLRDAQPLPPARWPMGTLHSIRHPDRNRWGMDSYRYYNESWAASLLDLAATVKTATQKRWLVGVSGGPAMALNETWNNAFSQAPWAVEHLLNSPQVDLLELPAAAIDRSLGSGASGEALMLADAARARDKMLWLRQELTPPPAWTTPGDAAARARDLVAMQRRDFASALQANAGIWLWQTAPDTLDDLRLLTEITAETAVLAKLRSRSPGATAPVAFVVDPGIAIHRGPDPRQELMTPANLHRAIVEGRSPDAAAPVAAGAWFLESLPRSTWPRAGFQYDVVTLDDLQPEAYRLVVLYHTLRLTDEQQERLAAARGGGRTQLWLWADGIADETTLSLSLASRRMGLRLGLQNAPGRFDLTPAPALAPLLADGRLDGYLGWLQAARQPQLSLQVTFGPRFFVQDDAAVALAHWRDGQRVAIARRDAGSHRLYYSATPLLNPEFLRAVAAEAGVHIYSPSNTWCRMDARFIALHTQAAGAYTLQFEQDQALYEVFAQHEFAPQRRQDVALQGNSTYLFFRGTKAEWDAL